MVIWCSPKMEARRVDVRAPLRLADAVRVPDLAAAVRARRARGGRAVRDRQVVVGVAPRPVDGDREVVEVALEARHVRLDRVADAVVADEPAKFGCV